MKSVKGIYKNGQLTLEEEIPTDAPVEVVVVYDDTNLPPKKVKRRTPYFPSYDVKLDDPGQKFSREELY